MPLDPTRDLASLLDIATAAHQIQRYCSGISRARFEHDDEKQAAVLYRIGIIGEAVKRISPEFRDLNPDIPWKQIAGMRDIVMHQYDRVNLELVWDVVQTKIPELLNAIQPLLPPES
jgi:uncharacterized protein with HEPN domain